MGAPRERLIERALALIVEGEVAPGEAAQNARAAMNQWRNRSPEHAAALLEARHRWDMLGGMAGDLRAHFDTPAAGMAAAAAATSARSPQRRKLLLSIVGLVGGGLVFAELRTELIEPPHVQSRAGFDAALAEDFS